jgi:hypothetical protein
MLTVAKVNSPARPPYALAELCFSQLHDLERFFGTAVLAEALKRVEADPGHQARKRGLDPERLVRDIQSLYADLDLELPAYAAAQVAKARSLPVAAPFPGAAVPTQSTAAPYAA